MDDECLLYAGTQGPGDWRTWTESRWPVLIFRILNIYKIFVFNNKRMFQCSQFKKQTRI